MAEGNVARGKFATRTAECMLRALGSPAVTLRYTSRVKSGDARQLGLARPESEDAVVGPAVVRNLEAEGGVRVSEVLLGAETVAEEMARRNAGSADELFAEIVGVVRGEMLCRLLSVAPVEFAGMEYLYRLKVAE